MNKSIIFFHPSSELYGADKILTYIMKCYPDYKKTVILKSQGPLIDLLLKEFTDVKIEIIPTLPVIAKKNLKVKGIISFLFSLLIFKKSIRHLYKENPSIIYLNTLATIPVLFYFKNRKKVIHVHEILSNNNLLNKTINKVALKHADHIICVSNAVLHNFKLNNTKFNDKLQLVQNGINFNKIENTTKDFIPEIDRNKINFALIGRIKPSHKGQLLLLKAISMLPYEYVSKSHFYLIGSPVPGQEYMLDDVVEEITKLCLQNHVTIISFIKDIENIYKEMDVIIVPSTFDDPFPTTVLEGMFFSKPIIGTRVGGIPEMIDDRISGFITNRDDSEDLSKKIIFFIDNPSEIKRMGENGRLRFNNNFSEESFYDKYSKIIKNIIEK